MQEAYVKICYSYYFFVFLMHEFRSSTITQVQYCRDSWHVSKTTSLSQYLFGDRSRL